MKILGYTDRLSVSAGMTIQFMVSSEHRRYRADLVRLIHGDTNSDGPGFKDREVASSISGEYPGRRQEIHSGSYIRIPSSTVLEDLRSFTVSAWVFPTTSKRGVQGLMGAWSENPVRQGFALMIGERGDLCLRLANSAGDVFEIATGVPLLDGDWTHVGASYDASSGSVVVAQQPKRAWPGDVGRMVVVGVSPVKMCPPNESPFFMACLTAPREGTRGAVVSPYNGKLDKPRLYSRALAQTGLFRLAADDRCEEFDECLGAAWDLSHDLDSNRVADTGPHALHGMTVNMPTRGVTGHDWTGEETSFRLAPDQYGAIHFHDDDLEDAGWDVDFTLTIPRDLPSGVYAARLRAESDEDYVPFCVRPAERSQRARIAVLMPTLTYVAYANFRDLDGGFWSHDRLPNANAALHPDEYAYIRANGLPGLYERHSDGSGTVFVSHLRPILNMRPKFRYRVWAAPSRFPADLYLIDWLDANGYAVDVITDHDLHNDGADLLASYSVILTGGHPEYWTTPMRAGLDSYLENGGHLMYLGGNGFFGVTSIHPDHPHIIEVRRWGTSWPFEMPPGERVHSTTGEPGGTWRNRGRAPQSIVGVGSCAAGFDQGAAYRRQPGSFDSRVAFIFQGVGENELIGDFPSLMVKHGAAGYEIDRVEPELGTPPHTLLLASSFNHSSRYSAFADEMLEFTRGKDGVLPGDSPTAGQIHPFIRADMAYFETPNGGAVFSVGSIAWRGSLSYNVYNNNVSRITANVLNRFMA